MFFERDVNCVINFFRKRQVGKGDCEYFYRFGFESETFPQFSYVVRLDTIDMEAERIGLKEDLAELIKAVRQQLWNESNNCDAGTTGELNEEPLEHVHVELDEDFDGWNIK
ncbi:hypothetical protein HUJ05_002348 [Dendroctonus ponderosae]|nr:hypothetical protein HUJ05_002348 [Dendroctonus ponderosae]